jgi:predicted nucleic acid binding AN1-type Zn finger protein
MLQFISNMSLHDSTEKINPVKDREGSQRPSVFNGVKQFIQSEKGKDVLIVIIIILVGLGSFELGRLSKNDIGSPKMEYKDPNSAQDANITDSAVNGLPQDKSSTIINSSGKNFFASSKGKKYYTINCSAGKTIKQENRVYFTTGEEAEKAGYTLSSECK